MRAAALLVLTLASGCLGARAEIRADALDAPVSMSGWLLKDGATLSPKQLTTVGSFSFSRRAWSMLYGHQEQPGPIDVSDAINAEVKAKRGDGVVNLSLSTSPCWVSGLGAFFLLPGLLPFMPGCVDVDIWGDVVQVKPLPSP